MQGKRKETVEITLVLTQKEADWLKALVQNPMIPTLKTYDEPVEQANMRCKLFKALSFLTNEDAEIFKGAYE
jgi:hypothetical protein